MFALKMKKIKSSKCTNIQLNRLHSGLCESESSHSGTLSHQNGGLKKPQFDNCWRPVVLKLTEGSKLHFNYISFDGAKDEAKVIRLKHFNYFNTNC